MLQKKKFIILAGIFIVLFFIFSLFSRGGASKGTLVVKATGPNLATYTTTIDGDLVTDKQAGLERTYNLIVGEHRIIVEAVGYSTYTENIVVAKDKRTDVTAALVLLEKPQLVVAKALGTTEEDITARYAIKNATYFVNGTWLVAELGSLSSTDGAVNNDGEKIILQLVNGQWVVVFTGTSYISSELVQQGVPAEIVDFLPSLSASATASGNRDAQVPSLSESASPGPASCRTDPSSNLCSLYLRTIGAYYASATASGNKCSATSSGTGGFLTINYPSGITADSLGKQIEDYIRKRTPNSPWLTIPNVGRRLVEDGEKYNVNPLLVVVLGVTESNLGMSKVAKEKNNYFGIKGGGSYRTFSSPEDGLFGPDSIMPRMPARLASNPNYKNVKNLYEYFSVHVSGQILYPGDGIKIYDPIMDVYVSGETDAQYGPAPYWRIGVGVINAITGQNYPNTAPSRGDTTLATVSSTGSCAKGAGEGGWDLLGDGPNPMVYYSQLYACGSTPPAGRTFARACDPAIGANNAFGANKYGTGTIEQCGCGPTSLAMIVSTLTNKTVTPVNVAEYAEKNGGVAGGGCGSDWFWTGQATQDFYGITSNAINTSEMAASLRSGRMIIVSLSKFPTLTNDVGHISVIRKVDSENNFYFADPYAGGWGSEQKPATASRMKFTEAQIAGMVKGVWEISPK